MPSDILILRASHGSLLGSKLLMAGHNVTLVCRRKTADPIRSDCGKLAVCELRIDANSSFTRRIKTSVTGERFGFVTGRTDRRAYASGLLQFELGPHRISEGN